MRKLHWIAVPLIIALSACSTNYYAFDGDYNGKKFDGEFSEDEILIKKEMFNDRVREVLSYVPSAIFAAIIFPAIFLDSSGVFKLTNNPKIFAAIIAMVVGIFSRSIIVTIISGLVSYWVIIFVILN